jgi:hypothetical protein
VSRLEDLGIRRIVEGPAVSLYVRGNCIAAVGGTQGSTGVMTESGLAYLVWRDGKALLSAKGTELPATPEQVEEIRQFTEDLKSALST